jgi:hypothetical protein
MTKISINRNLQARLLEVMINSFDKDGHPTFCPNEIELINDKWLTNKQLNNLYKGELKSEEEGLKELGEAIKNRTTNCPDDRPAFVQRRE